MKNRTSAFILMMAVIVVFGSPKKAFADKTLELSGGIDKIIAGLRMSKADNAASDTGSSYLPGQLIVKVKEGMSINDLEHLNSKYNVTVEPAYPDIGDPQESIKELREELAGLNSAVCGNGWYWQLDKNYHAGEDIQKQRSDIESKIRHQEERMKLLADGKERLPSKKIRDTLKRNYVLRVSKDTDIEEMRQEYSSDQAVEFAEPNYTGKLTAVPNDPYYDYSQVESWDYVYGNYVYSLGIDFQINQWAHEKTGAPSAWDITTGSEDVVVALIDSGALLTHEDLVDNLVQGKDFVDGDNIPSDTTGHGTEMAGVIAARGNNGKGISGVCQRCRIMPVKIMDPDDTGSFTVNIQTFSEALIYAVSNGAKVVNMSVGFSDRSDTVEEAINLCSDEAVFVASAGNSGLDTKLYPAGYDNVIAVSATDEDDQITDFSNYGNWVDIAAPGDNIFTTCLNIKAEVKAYLAEANSDIPEAVIDEWLSHYPSNIFDYVGVSGTSPAAAYVSGLAGLILSKYPGYTPQQVRNAILNNADDLGSSGKDDYYGYGRVNLYKSLYIGAGSEIYASITSPTSGQKVNSRIEIKGTASTDNFSYYTIDVGIGAEPSSWLTISGITMANEGKVRVENGILGYWDAVSFSPGTFTLRLEVFDSLGNSKEARISVDVYNTAPVIDISSVQLKGSYEAGEEVEILTSVSDADTAKSSLLCSWYMDNWIESIANTETLKYVLPASVSAGTHVVKLVVDDQEGGTAEQSFSITVADNNVPVIVSFSDVSASYEVGAGENKHLEFTVEASDADNDSLSYSWEVNGDAVSASGQSYSADFGAGSHTVKVTVSDGKGGSVSHSWAFAVTAPNSAPVIDISRVQLKESYVSGDRVYIFTSVSDADTPRWRLKYSWIIDSSSDVIGVSERLMYTLPAGISVGSHVIKFTVEDGQGGKAEQEFNITVAANQAPVIDISSVQLKESYLPKNKVTIMTKVSDADTAKWRLRYIWTMDGSSTSIGRGEKLLSYVLPAGTTVGTHVIKLTVEDGQGGKAEQEFAINVVDQNTPGAGNKAPVIDITDVQLEDSYVPGDRVTIMIKVSDADTAKWRLRYIWTMDGSSTSIGRGEKLLSYVLPAGTTVGTHVIKLTVEDGQGGKAEQEFNITVAANQAPVIDVSAVQIKGSYAPGDRVTIMTKVSDADTARWRLTYIWTMDGSSTSIGRGEKLLSYLLPEEITAGTHVIKLAVEDGQGGRAEQEFAINVVIE